MEFILTDQKEKKKKDYLRDLWCNIKRNDILIVGVPEGEQREKGEEHLFEEIMAKNIPNWGKETDIEV